MTPTQNVNGVEDFQGVVRNVSRLLREGGIFLFSQEHPCVTCYSGVGDRWTRDENGKKLHVNIANADFQIAAILLHMCLSEPPFKSV